MLHKMDTIISKKEWIYMKAVIYLFRYLQQATDFIALKAYVKGLGFVLVQMFWQ